METVFFELDVMICEKFPALTPLSLRRERAADVFELISNLIDYLERENIRKAKEIKRGGKKRNVIRVPAGDDWF